MDLSKPGVKKLTPVTSLDAYDGGTKNFHDDGLFSVKIFGPVGSEIRDQQFSAINIKTTILHPVIYSRLIKLKALYQDILSGNKYALWDEEAKDFVASNEMEGQTGFAFFLEHWKKIEFKQTGSSQRDQRIQLIEKYKDISLVDKVLIIPAGLRELFVDENGREKEDDINSLYRRVLGISNTIGVSGKATETENFDNTRHLLQLAFNDIYNYLENILRGKRGFIENKWGKRRIFYGTRNVITSMDTSVPDLDKPNSPGLNDTVIGLYQLCKSILPKTKYLLLSGYLDKAFGSSDGKALLINRKTLKQEYVDISSEVFDKWFTNEGIEKFINGYRDVASRHNPVVIEDHYLALLFRFNNTFKVFFDIDELPEGYDKNNVTPLTKCQLLYLSGFTEWNKTVGFVTRYPVTSKDSIYPSTVYCKTTVKGELRYELDDQWNETDRAALEFPIESIKDHTESMSPHSSKLSTLGAD